MLAAHGWLTHHANCAGADVLGLSDATGYDSDDDEHKPSFLGKVRLCCRAVVYSAAAAAAGGRAIF